MVAAVAVSLTGLLTSLVVGALLLALKIGAVLAIGYVVVKVIRRLDRGGGSAVTTSGDGWLDTRS